jgi:hypothetical protein
MELGKMVKLIPETGKYEYAYIAYTKKWDRE